MKKIIILFSFIQFGTTAFTQNWSFGGNSNPPLSNPANRFLGTNTNFDLNIGTAGITRMHINQNGTNYLGVDTWGYIGIGFNPTDVRSRLTITGTNNTFFGGGGYLSWMKTGIFNLENSDNLYIGLKEEGANRSDAVLAFGDDNNGLPNPLNNFRILFTGTGGANSPHLEIARYTAGGNIGFGPVFGDNNLLVPKSLLHMNMDGTKETWLQISNQGATGMLATDGLRLGVPAGVDPPSILQWQERTPFIVQTDWNNFSGGVTGGERLRISSINAPGVPNPANLDNNITRVAISHLGSQPITQPRSLLHLGYNTGGLLGSTVDGWRDWMDVGTFTAGSTDNMYVGLKREPGFIPAQNDRYDAVINWGDNQNNLGGAANIGPDNLRFIFTSTIGLGGGDPVSQSNDGLEVMRMIPNKATTLPNSNFGMVGIGNFYSANTAAADIVNAKLDIDGDLRIRTVTERSDLTQVLVIDPNDKNRVHWKTITTSGGGGTFGVDCADNSGAADLLFDSKVNLNDFNFYFENGSTDPNNKVGVGFPCGTTLPGKLNAFQNQSSATNLAGFFRADGSNLAIGVFGLALLATNNIGGNFRASAGSVSTAVQAFGGLGTNENYGVRANGFGGTNNFGIWATAGNLVGPGNSAGYFVGDVTTTGTAFGFSDSTIKQNVVSEFDALKRIGSLRPVNYTMRQQDFPFLGLSGGLQHGFISQEVEVIFPELVQDIIHPAEYDSLGNETSPSITLKGLNYNGFISLNTQAIRELNQKVDRATLSDESIKTNVLDLSGSLDKILAMRGVSYDWN